MAASSHGILGLSAPELGLKGWIGKDGGKRSDLKLSALRGKIVVMEFWQSWCPGCHSHGLPAMRKISEAFRKDKRIKFLGVQTVFEGHRVNTRDKLRKIQLQHRLNIPMAHDPGTAESGGRSVLMQKYRSGGTPWMIIIDHRGKVVYNDYHIQADKGISLITKLLKDIPVTNIPAVVIKPVVTQ